MFLPQFHADPYNDEWWGEGFTEWVNVKKTKPLFEGHRQPRVPQNSEYFSLDNAEEIDLQFREAQEHGVDGFVFYHYWSLGRRLLKTPLDILLDNPDIAKGSEFSLCWANHSWTRAWTNRSGASEVLMPQEYETSPEAMEEHIAFLLRCFSDPRYTRIDGRPLFQIYRKSDIVEFDRFAALLQEQCLSQLGTRCHISILITGPNQLKDFTDTVDSAILAQPASAHNGPEDILETSQTKTAKSYNLRYFFSKLPNWMQSIVYSLKDRFFSSITIWDYETTWAKILRQSKLASQSPKAIFYGAFVDFDNTARYGDRAKLYKNFTIDRFSTGLEEILRISSRSKGDGFVVINAWNEWAEGMYLQADEEFGNQRLEAIKAVKLKLTQEQSSFEHAAETS